MVEVVAGSKIVKESLSSVHPEYRFHDIVLMGVPALLHSVKEPKELSFIERAILLLIDQVEELRDFLDIMVELQVLAAEHEVVSPAFLVLVDVEELEGFHCASEVDSEFVLELLEQYLKG